VPKLDGFANIWEHTRLLSDSARTQAYIELLHRYAAGHRVLEIGCGTGLLSCIAAKLGATKVYAVEPTGISEIAKTLITRNNLQDVVEVLDGRLEDLKPRPVDLAFSELLNADPFAEGVVDVTNAARSWLVPGALLAPQHLRVYAALCYGTDCARETRLAQQSIKAFGTQFDLKLDPLIDAMHSAESYRFMSSSQAPISEPVLLYDIPLGVGLRPNAQVEVEAVPYEAGVIDGVMVWFECVVSDDITLTNTPDTQNHWGQLICAWSHEKGVRAGQPVRLRASLSDGALDVRLADKPQ